MISSLLATVLLGASPDLGAAITEARRAFIEDGADLVSATPTHRVISHADGSLELQGAQPLQLSLRSIAREGAGPCRTLARSRVVDAAAPRTVRTQRACALEETWTNGPAGLEQAFVLRAPPPGKGALTLSLAVRGPWHHSDASGQVFAGPGAAASVRYGDAFVVRAGRKTPLEVRHVEGGLELKVPRELVDAPGAFPMFIDPLVSSPVPLANPGAIQPLPTEERRPAIALNAAGTAMVVWVDNRRQNGTDLFGARLDANGALLDGNSIPVALEPGHQLEPTICADGTGWLVAYASEASTLLYRVRGVRVDSQGAVGPSFLIDSGRQPALAAMATGSVLAYVDSNSALQVVRISGTTTTQVGSGPAADGPASNPAIAASDTSWFVAWVSTPFGAPTPVIRTLSTTTGVVILDQLGTAASPTNPTVALGGTNGNTAFVYWEQGADVVGVRIDGTVTTPLVPRLNARSPALAPGSAGVVPALGFFSGNTLLVIDASSITTPTPVNVGAGELVLVARSRITAAWTEDTLLGADVWATSFPAGATVTPAPVTLAQAPAAQRLPHVAFADGQRDGLAVWVEGSSRVRAARVQLQNDGGVSTNTPFEVQPPGVGSGVVALEVAASAPGGEFLVAWALADGAVAAGLTDLSALREGPFPLYAPSPLPGAVWPVALAWDQQSAKWVVAWEQGQAGVQSSLVDTAAVISGSRPLTTEVATDLGLACREGTCLVAWRRALDLNIRATTFTAATAPAMPLTLGVGQQPVVTDDGTDFIVGFRSLTGFTLARVDPINLTVEIPGAVPDSTGVRMGSLSLGRGNPPVMAWSEFDTAADVWSLYVERMRFPLPARATAGHGFLPNVATLGLAGEPRGVMVSQDYEAAPVQSMRGWARAFVFPAVDAGLRDAGVDAGVDGGVDAGTEVDAGRPEDGGADAGLEDGGVPEAPDAGLATFTTTGCTCQSLASAPLALALLLLLRRARR